MAPLLLPLGVLAAMLVLNSAANLGYLTVYVADLIRKGQPVGENTAWPKRLEAVWVRGDEVILGPPMKFTAENIEQYDF